MKKKDMVRNIPNKWEKKSTFYLALVSLGLVILFMIITVIPEYYRNKKLEKYEGETTGIILSINAIETVSQRFEGAKTLTPFYTVDFAYKVNGTKYQNSNNIPNDGKYEKFIREIYDSNFKKEIIVRFKSINPKESLIKIE
ncbi:MAG TPA: hypothetical protein VFG54_13860 [Prolixibacteraceae bacterium]|nr:hypothetical protein [Prolixibacteraceae bacterium]